MNINLGDARDKLSQLVQQVLEGENITICRNGEPVVDLVPTRASRPPGPRFGTMKGQITINDPDWHKGPQTDEEVVAWLNGEFR
jgi:prevent-host-death family protein